MIGRAAELYGATRDHLEEWSAQNGWVERAAAYDIHRDRLRLEAEASAWADVRKKELEAGEGALDAALAGLGSLDHRKLSAHAIANLLDTGSRTVRLAHGQPTDLVKGALLVHPTEVTQTIGRIVEISLRYIDDDRRDAFLRDVSGTAT